MAYIKTERHKPLLPTTKGQIAVLCEEGRSIKEIADKMDISSSHVLEYIKILDNLSASERFEIIYEEGKRESICAMFAAGYPVSAIARRLYTPPEKVRSILNENGLQEAQNKPTFCTLWHRGIKRARTTDDSESVFYDADFVKDLMKNTEVEDCYDYQKLKGLL